MCKTNIDWPIYNEGMHSAAVEIIVKRYQQSPTFFNKISLKNLLLHFICLSLALFLDYRDMHKIFYIITTSSAIYERMSLNVAYSELIIFNITVLVQELRAI